MMPEIRDSLKEVSDRIESRQIYIVVVAPRETDALAERMVKLVEDPSLRGRMERSGRDWVEAHVTADQIASTIVDACNRPLDRTAA